MSRTYRRKSGDTSEIWWIYYPYEWDPLMGMCLRTRVDRNSKEVIKKVAKYYSDGYVGFKEPGPSWFRNLYTERPQRREAKKVLKQYMHNPEIEIMLLSKNPLEYWT